METILAGQNVTAATAGRLSIRYAEGTTRRFTVGWLAIARASTLQVWLEMRSGRSDASRGLNVANETELGGRAVALAASPRSGDGGDDILVVTETLIWELVRLNPEQRFLDPTRGRTDSRINLSVLASGFLGSGPPRSSCRASRATSPEVALRLAVRGPSHDMDYGPGQDRARNGGSNTLVAGACEDQITLLVFSHDTSDDEMMITASVTVPLVPESVCDVRIGGAGSTITSRNHRQSRPGPAFTRPSPVPPPTLSCLSVVLDIAILTGHRTASTGLAAEVDSPAAITLLLIDRPRGGGGTDGGVDTSGNRLNGGRGAFLQTRRWDLRDGGGGALKPSHWGLANLHPATCIAALTRGGILCVDPNGVRAFSEDGDPLLDVRESPRTRGLAVPAPSFVRGSWGPTNYPVVLTCSDSICRGWGRITRRLCCGDAGNCQEFLLVDVDGNLHRVLVIVRLPIDTFNGSNCRAEQDTPNRLGDCVKIECVKLETSTGLMPCWLHHRLKFLQSVGSGGLVFAATCSSSFPTIVRVPCLSGALPPGVSDRSHADVQGVPGAQIEGHATLASWQMLERSEARRVSPSLGAVSGLIVLPELIRDGQEARQPDDFTTSRAQNTEQRYPFPPPHARSGALEEDVMLGLSKTRGKGVPRGARVVLATGTVRLDETTSGSGGSANDPSKCLGMLEYGLRLETDAEGSVGLPVGVTLFAQPVAPGGAGYPKEKRHSQSRNDDVGGGRDKQGYGIFERGYVLLLSDRVRSRTHILAVSPEGEVAPALEGERKGFDGKLHTVHLGRIEPVGYMVQVTEESVNIIQQSIEAGMFETVTCWRPPPPSPQTSPSNSFFKVQHACTAGTMVALVFSSTMVLIEMKMRTPTAAPRQTAPTLDGEGNASLNGKIELREVRRVELDGGPVSAIGMRTLGCNYTQKDETVLIATASWDSPSIAVFSFSTAHIATNNNSTQTAFPEDPQRGDPTSDSSAVLERVATWHPPWGSGTPNDEASALTEATLIEEKGGSGATFLTRALALVRFGKASEQMSLVAAAADGAVAVAQQQGGRGGDADVDDSGNGYAQARKKQTRNGSCLWGTLVTVASFQIGQGPVRLEVFWGAGRAGEAEASGGGCGHSPGGGDVHRNQGQHESCGERERVFVNGEMMDAVIHRCANAPVTDQCRSRWQCTQVCRVGRDPRQSVVHLPQKKAGATSSERIGGKFAWLTAKEIAREPRISSSCFDAGGRGGSHGEADIGDKAPARELSLSFGTLDESQLRGQLRHKKHPPWTPTHLLYAPATRSVVVACCTRNENEIDSENAPNTTTNTGATAAPMCGTGQGMRPSLPSWSSSSSLRVFDADTLEERPGAGPLRLRPGVRITGIALFSCPAGGGGSHSIPRGVADTAVKGTLRIGGTSRNLEVIPTAVGGDVVAVSCCSCQKEESTTTIDHGPGTAAGGVRSRHVEAEERTTGEAAIGSRDAGSPRDVPSVTPASAKTATPHLPSKEAVVSTVIAAFEVVAYESGVRGGGGTALVALAASPEMAAACFGLEALGESCVAAAADDRVVVFGWTGREGENLRPEVPTPPLNLSAQASCRTPSGGCVTALGTCGSFVAVAEFLHCVSLYRYDDSARSLSLVARHSRESLMVTALALSPLPSSPSAPTGVGAREEDNTTATGLPLVAVADRATKTVAVLACPCLRRPSSTTHARGLPTAATRIAAINDSSDFGEGGAGIAMVSSRESDDGRSSSGRGGVVADDTASSGSCDNTGCPLQLLSVWPCPDKVTSLVAASGDCDEDGKPAKALPLLSGGLGKHGGGLFLLGTDSGEISTFGINVPPKSAPIGR